MNSVDSSLDDTLFAYVEEEEVDHMAVSCLSTVRRFQLKPIKAGSLPAKFGCTSVEEGISLINLFELALACLVTV